MSELLEKAVPSSKYRELYDILGLKLLGHCTNVSQSAMSGLFEYKARVVHRNINERFQFLERIVEFLKGAYNKRGIRAWFYRKRRELKNRAPADILRGEWEPLHLGPQKVLSLAISIADGNAA